MSYHELNEDLVLEYVQNTPILRDYLQGEHLSVQEILI